MVKIDQQETELEFNVKYNYSIFSNTFGASGSAQEKVGLPWNGALKVQAKDGDEAKEKARQELEQRLKDATASAEKKYAGTFYILEICNAIQLGDPSRISLSQQVINEIENRFGSMRSGRFVPLDWPEHPEHRYDNPRFAEQLIPLILNAVQNKQEAGAALDLVTERIEYDGPHIEGPDTESFGYAGNAYVTYVRTYSALDFAKNTATLRKLIREKVE